MLQNLYSVDTLLPHCGQTFAYGFLPLSSKILVHASILYRWSGRRL